MPGLADVLRGLGPLGDPQFYRDMASNVPDAARGLLAQTLGSPVDVATMLMRPMGYKTQDQNVVGSTDWIGKKLGADINRMPFKLASMLPTDPGDAGKLAPGLAALLFHGSPHKFDKFDVSKIGTGEGAQSYGHGLYFAENPHVAQSYSQSGHLYKADVPDEVIPKMIDWDKPLSQQSDFVKEGLAKVGHPLVKQAMMRDWTGHKLIKTLEEALAREEQVPGQMLGITRKVGGPEAVSKALMEAGIPGTKYLDAGSRNAGTGTRNYVVFDDNMVQMLERK